MVHIRDFLREAESIALAFNAAGYHAVVLYYSLRYLFPESLKDISDTVCIIRNNADKWSVDSDKVIVCGFSAGGHLEASLGGGGAERRQYKEQMIKTSPMV